MSAIGKALRDLVLQFHTHVMDGEIREWDNGFTALMAGVGGLRHRDQFSGAVIGMAEIASDSVKDGLAIVERSCRKARRLPGRWS